MKRLEKYNISKRQLGLIFYNNARVYENESKYLKDEVMITKLIDSIEEFKENYYCKPCTFMVQKSKNVSHA